MIIKSLIPSSPSPAETAAILKRAEALDALDAILPFDRRDQLAELLTDEDVVTLVQLVGEGMGDNTMRALASDLGYLEAWCRLASGSSLPWPAPEDLLLTFVAQHLWNAAECLSDPGRGMPEDVAIALRARGLLRITGPHAPATVRRRLTSWSTLTRRRGSAGAFSAPALKTALHLAIKSSDRPEGRKSSEDVTEDILEKLLDSCGGDRLVDLRDRALLLLAFAAGGRRRSEMAGLGFGDLTDEPPVKRNPDEPASPLLPRLAIRLRRAGTASATHDEHVALVGEPVTALKRWIAAAGIASGAVFRRVDKWDNVDRRALTPQSVTLIVKSRAAKAGLDPAAFSAHGLRSGFLTEAANRRQCP